MICTTCDGVIFLLYFQERRLRDRGTETEESLSRRLDTAKKELAYGMLLL